MSIKHLSLIIFSVIVLGAVLLVVLTMMLVQSSDKLLASTAVRYQSYLLADELRQSSDDLTRLARTYAVTGDGPRRGDCCRRRIPSRLRGRAHTS